MLLNKISPFFFFFLAGVVTFHESIFFLSLSGWINQRTLRPFASGNVFVEHSSDKTIAVEQSTCAHDDELYLDDSFVLYL